MRLPISAVAKFMTPVMLPPGRLRLATIPEATGSMPSSKTIGIVEVAALAASGCRRRGDKYSHFTADEVCGHPGQAVIVTIAPAIFDRDSAHLLETGFAQAFAK